MKRLLWQHPSVKTIVSCVLGLGLALLFRPVVVASGVFSPPWKELQQALYQFGKQCFAVRISSIDCSPRRTTVAIPPPAAFA